MQASPLRTTEKLEEEGANELGQDRDPEGWHLIGPCLQL